MPGKKNKNSKKVESRKIQNQKENKNNNSGLDIVTLAELEKWDSIHKLIDQKIIKRSSIDQLDFGRYEFLLVIISSKRRWDILENMIEKELFIPPETIDIHELIDIIGLAEDGRWHIISFLLENNYINQDSISKMNPHHYDFFLVVLTLNLRLDIILKLIARDLLQDKHHLKVKKIMIGQSLDNCKSLYHPTLFSLNLKDPKDRSKEQRLDCRIDPITIKPAIEYIIGGNKVIGRAELLELPVIKNNSSLIQHVYKCYFDIFISKYKDISKDKNLIDTSFNIILKLAAELSDKQGKNSHILLSELYCQLREEDKSEFYQKAFVKDKITRIDELEVLLTIVVTGMHSLSNKKIFDLDEVKKLFYIN